MNHKTGFPGIFAFHGSWIKRALHGGSCSISGHGNYTACVAAGGTWTPSNGWADYGYADVCVYGFVYGLCLWFSFTFPRYCA